MAEQGERGIAGVYGSGAKPPQAQTVSACMATERDIAKKLGNPTFKSGRRCNLDGTYKKNTKTGKCSECEAYALAIRLKRIDGVDNSAAVLKPRRVRAGWHDEAGWDDEMRKSHGEAIKRGKKLAKERRLKLQGEKRDDTAL